MCSENAGRPMWSHSGVERPFCLIDNFARGQLGRADCQWCRARTLRPESAVTEGEIAVMADGHRSAGTGVCSIAADAEPSESVHTRPRASLSS